MVEMSLVGALGYSTNEYTISLKGESSTIVQYGGRTRGGEGGRKEPYD